MKWGVPIRLCAFRLDPPTFLVTMFPTVLATTVGLILENRYALRLALDSSTGVNMTRRVLVY